MPREKFRNKFRQKSFKRKKGQKHFEKTSHLTEEHKARDGKGSVKTNISENESMPDVNSVIEYSSEEERDDYTQLLSSFKANECLLNKKAIESDDSDSSPDNIEVKKTLDSETNLYIHGPSDTECELLSNDEYDDTETAKDAMDPFIDHFQYDIDDVLVQAVSSSGPIPVKSVTKKWPVLGQVNVQLPVCNENQQERLLKSKITVEEEKPYAKRGVVPERIANVNYSELCIKSQIHNNITRANFTNINSNIRAKGDCPFTSLQRELFSIINKYQDLYFPEQTLQNLEEIRFLYSLHAVNHILKTRLRILHHNAKLNRKEEVPDEFRDQGLVHPKVLILAPFKDSALRIVKTIIAILIPDEKANVINKKRFFDEYSGNEISMPKKNPRPEDYEATFSGNTDDTFKIGIKVTKKSLKLYADFYSADIIIASPLGLRVVIGAEGEAERDYDFLASIEVLILDQTDIFFMQNWDHLIHVLDHMHLQPRESHGTDFSRVRSWAVNGWSRYYRQTLLFSSFRLPEFTAIFNKKCRNFAGRIQVMNPVLTGTVCQVIVQVPQVFQKFDVPSIQEAIDVRFDYFIKKVLPRYKDDMMKHVLIFIPSYFDYVRLRNYFKREEVNFVQICEYSKENKIARARDLFFHDEAHFLLYSERFHFFRRTRIKGIRHILFYQPPTVPHFYSELCNLMQEANQNPRSGSDSNMTVTILYSKYDVDKLVAIVGTDRAKRMLTSDKNVHMIMTEI